MSKNEPKQKGIIARIKGALRGVANTHPRINYVWRIVSSTVDGIFREQVPRMSATISYWLLVTVAPLLLFVVSLFSFMNQMSVASLVDEVGAVALPTGTTTLDSLDFGQLVSGAVKFAGPFASVASVIMVLWGALAVFRQLVWALDVLWRKPMPRKGTHNFLRTNGLSALFFAVLSVAMVLVVAASTLLTNVVGSFSRFIEEFIPVQLPTTTEVVSFLIGIIVAALFFLVVFWIVPGKRVKPREVVAGALVTSIFYGVGQLIFTKAIGESHRYDVYGAFSIFVALIVFIYYMAIIILGGTVFTRSLVQDRERYGSDHIRSIPRSILEPRTGAEGAESAATAPESTYKVNPYEKTVRR